MATITETKNYTKAITVSSANASTTYSWSDPELSNLTDFLFISGTATLNGTSGTINYATSTKLFSTTISSSTAGSATLAISVRYSHNFIQPIPTEKYFINDSTFGKVDLISLFDKHYEIYTTFGASNTSNFKYDSATFSMTKASLNTPRLTGITTGWTAGAEKSLNGYISAYSDSSHLLTYLPRGYLPIWNRVMLNYTDPKGQTDSRDHIDYVGYTSASYNDITIDIEKNFGTLHNVFFMLVGGGGAGANCSSMLVSSYPGRYGLPGGSGGSGSWITGNINLDLLRKTGVTALKVRVGSGGTAPTATNWSTTSSISTVGTDGENGTLSTLYAVTDSETITLATAPAGTGGKAITSATAGSTGSGGNGGGAPTYDLKYITAITTHAGVAGCGLTVTTEENGIATLPVFTITQRSRLGTPTRQWRYSSSTDLGSLLGWTNGTATTITYNNSARYSDLVDSYDLIQYEMTGGRCFYTPTSNVSTGETGYAGWGAGGSAVYYSSTVSTVHAAGNGGSGVCIFFY